MCRIFIHLICFDILLILISHIGFKLIFINSYLIQYVWKYWIIESYIKHVNKPYKIVYTNKTS